MRTGQSNFFAVTAALWWLSMKRLLRGWRWRGFLLLTLPAAYWFSRVQGFGPGASVWFPGGAGGIGGFTVFVALGAIILAVYEIGQWDSSRARTLFETRMTAPFAVILSRWFAVTAVSLLPAAVLACWTPFGAWRFGYEVLWLPTALYMAAVAVPVLLLASAAGLAARLLVSRDGGAILLAMAVTAPALAYRLLSAPARELYLLSSPSLGVLIPAETILREALLTGGGALLWVGVAALSLPRPRGRTPHRKVKGVVFPARAAVVTAPLLRILSGWRQWSLLRLAAVVVPLVIGVAATASVIALRPRPVPVIAWNEISPPPGTSRGVLRPWPVEHRSVQLPDSPTGTIEAALELRAPVGSGGRFLALNFGPTLTADNWSASSGHQVAPWGGASTPETGITVLELTPPVSEGATVTISATLRARPTHIREWERAYHPIFRRFSFLGPWYGAPVLMNYGNAGAGTIDSPSPYSVTAPDVSPQRWVAGAAKASATEDGRIELVHAAAGLPSRLISAELITSEVPDGSLPVQFVALPHRAEMLRGLHRALNIPFTRLQRAFGNPSEPIVICEVPEQQSSDPLAIGSSQMDYLQELYASYDDFENPTRQAFHFAFMPVHRGIVAALVTNSFAGFEHPELLRDGLIEYLNGTAFNWGLGVEYAREMRRDIILVPPGLARMSPRAGEYILASSRPQWEGPATVSLGRDPASPADSARPAAFHHMLRGVIGEEAYVAALMALFQEHRGGVLTLATFRQVMEQAHGEDLGWLFDQWLIEGVVPHLRIIEAQAVLTENPETRALEYFVTVRVKNEGTGRMPIPWVILTEADPVEGEVWLGPGVEEEIRVKLIDRPQLFQLDPKGWVSQVPHYEPGTRGPIRPSIMFKAIRQM